MTSTSLLFLGLYVVMPVLLQPFQC